MPRKHPWGAAQAPYGYVYMCKDGYNVMVVRPLFVARNLFLGQSGFASGAGFWVVFVLLFVEHDTVNPGFSLCILPLFLDRIKVVAFDGSREMPLSLPFTCDSFILGLSFFTVEELVFSEFLKKVGCFCSIEANPSLFRASSVDCNTRIRLFF